MRDRELKRTAKKLADQSNLTIAQIRGQYCQMSVKYQKTLNAMTHYLETVSVPYWRSVQEVGKQELNLNEAQDEIQWQIDLENEIQELLRI